MSSEEIMFNEPKVILHNVPWRHEFELWYEREIPDETKNVFTKKIAELAWNACYENEQDNQAMRQHGGW